LSPWTSWVVVGNGRPRSRAGRTLCGTPPARGDGGRGRRRPGWSQSCWSRPASALPDRAESRRAGTGSEPIGAEAFFVGRRGWPSEGPLVVGGPTRGRRGGRRRARCGVWAGIWHKTGRKKSCAGRLELIQGRLGAFLAPGTEITTVWPWTLDLRVAVPGPVDPGRSMMVTASFRTAESAGALRSQDHREAGLFRSRPSRRVVTRGPRWAASEPIAIRMLMISDQRRPRAHLSPRPGPGASGGALAPF